MKEKKAQNSIKITKKKKKQILSPSTRIPNPNQQHPMHLQEHSSKKKNANDAAKNDRTKSDYLRHESRKSEAEGLTLRDRRWKKKGLMRNGKTTGR